MIRPNTEETVTRTISSTESVAIEAPDPFRNILKLLSGGGLGALIGLTLFAIIQLVGIRFGGVETSILVGLPSLLGILASYVIF